jgi:hypothetical protein
VSVEPYDQGCAIWVFRCSMNTPGSIVLVTVACCRFICCPSILCSHFCCSSLFNCNVHSSFPIYLHNDSFVPSPHQVLLYLVLNADVANQICHNITSCLLTIIQLRYPSTLVSPSQFPSLNRIHGSRSHRLNVHWRVRVSRMTRDFVSGPHEWA